MSIWLTMALMTMAAIFAVLWPLGRQRHAHAMSDADVYRAQLHEVERSLSLGTLTASEAESVRAEVARRLLAAVDRDAAPVSASLLRRRIVALAIFVAIPLLAGTVYALVGNPRLPDQPLEARFAPRQDAPIMLIARVEEALRRNPEDGRGWDVIAPVYLRMGRPEDAARAYANVLRLLGETASRQAGYGEALTFAAKGKVTQEALAAFQRARELDAMEPRARFYLAIARDQSGDRAGAIGELRSFLSDSPPDAAWRERLEQAIADFEGTAP